MAMLGEKRAAVKPCCLSGPLYKNVNLRASKVGVYACGEGCGVDLTNPTHSCSESGVCVGLTKPFMLIWRAEGSGDGGGCGQ